MILSLLQFSKKIYKHFTENRRITHLSTFSDMGNNLLILFGVFLLQSLGKYQLKYLVKLGYLWGKNSSHSLNSFNNYIRFFVGDEISFCWFNLN